ncbi:calcium-dependent phosphotriesterase [Ceratobasidium sp. AG-I]|nr:calcium-dependent phosphotriesterase [Ceratobasidium sp. AG-I]
MWTNFYVNERGGSTGTGPFTCSASQPFISTADTFKEDILGDNPDLVLVAEMPGLSQDSAVHDDMREFHEAGVYVPETNEVFFTSNLMRKSSDSGSGFEYFIHFSKISLTPGPHGEYHWEKLKMPPKSLVLPNGGTFYNGKVLMVSQGYQLATPSAIVAVNPQTLQTEVLLNNFYGRLFNSMNDIAVLMRTDVKDSKIEDQWIFFTDPPYGYYQGFKPYPRLPSQVYAFHPPTGSIRAVADGFHRPNGIVFSPDMRTCYISDTGFASAVADDPRPLDGSRPGSIYAYDVLHPPAGSNPATFPPALKNRRLFAFADCGAPDGIKCDTQGNVYGGCFDGVHVWNENGALVGKILLEGRGCANLVFVPDGLLMFAEDRMYLARIKAKGALLP